MLVQVQGEGLTTNSVERADSADSGKNSESSRYILGPNDVIQVRVYQEPDLDAHERVNQDGTVTLPLLGTIALGGKSVERATLVIRDLLAKDFLVSPQVTVTVAEYAKRRFIVLGQVQRPGPYELPSEKTMSLLQAIATAGGYTRIGSPRKVTVQRVVDGAQKIFKLDAEAMSKDKDGKSFEILAEDTITVGEKLF